MEGKKHYILFSRAASALINFFLGIGFAYGVECITFIIHIKGTFSDYIFIIMVMMVYSVICLPYNYVRYRLIKREKIECDKREFFITLFCSLFALSIYTVLGYFFFINALN